MKKVLLFFLACLLAACQSNTGGIGVSVTHCCPEAVYRTFFSEIRDMPAFLEPLVKVNFDAAFAARGMVLDENHSDLRAVLRYEQEDLPRPSPPDEFEGQISPGGNVRYIARVRVDLFDTSTGEKVWAGSVQRIHDVDPGEYMHSGPASRAIFEAFVRLLDHFSVPATEY